ALIGLAGADDAGVRPYRNPSPLPFLNHVGIGLLDESPDPREHFTSPISQVIDPSIYKLRRGLRSLSLGCLIDHCCSLLFVPASAAAPLVSIGQHEQIQTSEQE